MKRPQQYHASFANSRYIPSAIWVALLIFIGFSIIQAVWLWHRSQQVGAMQVQLQSFELLPSQGQHDLPPDPAQQQSYRELLEISAQLTQPVHVWMACLQPPENIPVRIASFDWSTATQAIDMRLSVYHRDEFARYLQAIGQQEYPCSASLRQEERTQEGGYQLSLRLYSLSQEIIDER